MADHPLADVRHGQERQAGVAPLGDLVVANEGQQAAVAEHRRLGLAGGAGGEHQVGQRLWAECLPALFDLGTGNFAGAGQEAFQRQMAAAGQGLVEAHHGEFRQL
ncbi:hypothetical protein D9M70_279880 [compost metagenome]